MKPGPLRRMIAAVGLAAIVPVALMTLSGVLTPAEAGVRAAMVFGVVLLLTRVADLLLSSVAASYERKAAGERAAAERDSELVGERRAT